MYQAFLTYLKENHLLKSKDRVLLAVSGGVDSMTMAELFLKAGYQVSIAHVNYGLRGADSDNDQALVEQWCDSHGISCHLRQVNRDEYDIQESIQMVARRIRYDFFDTLMGHYDCVATAHNANDNAETVLLNLTKGTGIHGLEGIAPKRGHLIRPLLFATRAEILAYAKQENIRWREDKSNQKNDYQRNLLRNEVIPLLKQINPNLEHTFQNTIERMLGTAQLVNEAVEVRAAHIERQGDIDLLDLDWFANDRKSTVLLAEMIKGYGFSYVDASDLSHAIERKEPGKIFNSATHEINLDRNNLLIRKITSHHTMDHYIPEQMGTHQFGNIVLVMSILSGNVFERGAKKNVAYLDLDRIKYPLRMRNWQQGDVFRPLGMVGKKKVSDFMIDHKIPVTLKQDVMVLESKGEIVWVMGHRVDDRFKVTEETTRMLKIELTDHA